MRSMTGFGKGEADCNGSRITAEISGVNRKQLELRIAAPAEFNELESLARKLVAERVSRGALQLRISYTAGGNAAGMGAVDAAYLQALIAAAQQARQTAGLSLEVAVEQLMLIPGVASVPMPATDAPGLREAYVAAVTAALERFDRMREAEGAALQQDAAARLAVLRDLKRQLEPLVADIAACIRQRLTERLARENLVSDCDDERLLKEILFYADKSDVSEELTRLESHFSQFDRFLAESKPVGRSLDFLMQEMFREINTLGNKAGIPEVSALVVAFKSELEKLREQIQNME